MFILIVDDHYFFRDPFREFIELIDDSFQVSIAKDGRSALDKLQQQKFDLVITDLSMPVMGGAELFEQAMQLPQPPRFVFNSMYKADDYIKRYFNSGYLVGYFTKCNSESELTKGLRVICDGGIYFCERLHDVIAHEPIAGWTLVDQQTEALSLMEEKVLKGICEQTSNKEIAEKLFLSEETVKTHRRNIKRKLKITHTAGLIIYAIKTGKYLIE
jgi:DNA-binding NarL/FixJ family response regulator